jgi:predicted small metal-binding protein
MRTNLVTASQEGEMSDKKLHDEVSAAENNPSVQPSQSDTSTSASPIGTTAATGKPDEMCEHARRREAWSPEARGAGDVRFTSYPQNEAAQNPSAWESSHGDRSLSCSDADCGWSVSGKSEEEVLGYMRAHARQVHGKNEFTSAELESARRAIHKRAA